MDPYVLFFVFLIVAFGAMIISYNVKRTSNPVEKGAHFIQRPTSNPLDRERMIHSLGLEDEEEDLDEVIESARTFYKTVYDTIIVGNISEEVAGFLARLAITDPYLIQDRQFKAILDLEVLMDKGAVYNEDGSLWNLEVLRKILDTLADFFLEKVESPLFASGDSLKRANFGVKFDALERLVKDARGESKSHGPSEPATDLRRERAEEEEARLIDEEYFEWWLVHWIIEKEERRREETPDRSIFTHKNFGDASFKEQDVFYDEDYDGEGDDEEVYDDYDSYWDSYDAGDVDDLDLDV